MPRTTCISSMQKWKLSLWRCTLSLKCQTLHSEYQLLAFDACCWTPIAPLAPAVCFSSEVGEGPLRAAHSLWGYAYLALLYHHLCQLFLLCKQALIFRGASPSLSTALKHSVTRAWGILLQWTAYDFRATFGFLVHISLPVTLHATLT